MIEFEYILYWYCCWCSFVDIFCEFDFGLWGLFGLNGVGKLIFFSIFVILWELEFGYFWVNGVDVSDDVNIICSMVGFLF